MIHPIDDKYKISPYLIIPLMYVQMVGVNILFFQRQVVEFAGYDAWISVLLTGASIHIVVWMMYRVLSSAPAGGDITAVNRDNFGKIAGNIVNVGIVFYFLFGAFFNFLTYIEVIQVWIFPTIDIMPISIVILVFVAYCVVSGFRSITGLSLVGLLFTLLFIIPQLSMTLPYAHPQNLLPVLNHSVPEVIESSKVMLTQYNGIEAILLFYPFVKTPLKSHKWAQITVLFVTFLYLVILVITFMYFSENQLLHTTWPTLNMLMVIQLPVLQRVEYLAISIWMIKILATICLSLWVACRGMKNALRIKPRWSLFVCLAAIAVFEYVLKDSGNSRRTTELFSAGGLYMMYAYIPCVFAITLLKRRWNRSA